MAGLAETAKLVSSLELKDNFTPTANKAMKSLGKLESTSFKVGQSIGKGLNNAARNLAKIGAVGAVALGGAVAFGIKSLGDLNRTQNQTQAVIESTGGKAQVTAVQVRQYAEALEDLSTVDDKVIQDGANMLLTFTNIGKDVFPTALKAANDMALAMAGGNVEAVDLKASSIQLGKALNDPIKGITALSKVGVTFDDKQKKRIARFVKEGKVVEAQRVILAELNKEFGKSSEAAGKGPEAVWRRLQDAGEGLSQVLATATLPALERLGTWLTRNLNDPAFMATVSEIGAGLGRAADGFVDFVQTVDFHAIGATLKVAAEAAGTIVGWFMKMPTWVQAAVIGGWGLNKLTGGALGDIVGTLSTGLIKGVLGMNAGVVHLTAGTVIGGGGGLPIPGGGMGPQLGPALPWSATSGGGGISSLGQFVKAGVITGFAIAASEMARLVGSAVATKLDEIGPTADGRPIAGGPVNVLTDILTFNFPALVGHLGDIAGDVGALIPLIGKEIGGPKSETITGNPSVGNFIDQLPAKLTDSFDRAIVPTTAAVDSMKGKLADDLATQTGRIDAAAQSTSSASRMAGVTAGAASRAAGFGVEAAIRANRPIVTTTVTVNVAAAQVQKSVTEQSRIGPGNGSAGGGYDQGTGDIN